MKPLDIADLRKKHANAIKNTATGKALGKALDDQQSEIAELRRLLRIAVAAWDRVDETVDWLADDEWFAMAKELINGKDGDG